VVLLVLLVALAGVTYSLSSCNYEDFVQYKIDFQKNYHDRTEELQRFNRFCQTLERNEQLNAEYPSATFGITQFADLTLEEFKDQYLMKDLGEVDYSLAPELEAEKAPVPSSFDWRNNSVAVVTPVYNQGSCGSCWAFSATENVESVWALSGNPLTSLSMQQVVDCDTQALGCQGGWPYTVYPYIKIVGGLESYQSYPYAGKNQKCQFNDAKVSAQVSNWGFITNTFNEAQIMNYVATTSPVSVCVDAALWSSYTGGIFPAAGCGRNIDHCVDITGYNVNLNQANSSYWWIRNSWGTTWGIEGYMQLEYGANACAVAQVVTSARVQH